MIISLLLAFLLLFFPKQSYAVYDPLSVPNNKYGIHIVDPNDLADVATLVNSNGGRWGYVTLVITEGDRNIEAWSKHFELLRRLHLIPIVRLATHTEGSGWVAPKKEDADQWARFLAALPWPTKNRYVIVFNEPNESGEGGGAVNPENYAEVLMALAKKLKETSGDFFILPAGFDASAPNGGGTMDEETFLRRAIGVKPELLDLLDGWTSHSYPNPGFSGSPYASGRGTLKTYEWELALLKNLGLKKDLPVFITETGWAHRGLDWRSWLLSPETVASYITVASQTVWNDPRIAAVTPFLFQYQQPLFAMFSWLIPGQRLPYPFYLAYQNITKISGDPHLYPSLEYLALLQQLLTL
ncbi:hypothetical protein HY086_02430 [Candidatus Gottesmanbacteria bacterium]|nr:hypothetical protein [Candidatus Gottesmanbacteria bacterium]